MPSLTMPRVKPLHLAFVGLALVGLAGFAHAVQPGEIVNDVLGLAVSVNPDAPGQTVFQGTPALVIGVRNDKKGRSWTRLLAADGSSGWTARQFQESTPAKLSLPCVLELWNLSPDKPSFPSDAETFPIDCTTAGIVGASEKPRVVSLEQLKFPASFNPFLMPWLEIRVGQRSGWVSPSEVQLTWNHPDLDGIVRAPFIGAESPGTTKDERVLHFEDILSKPSFATAGKAAWGQREAVIKTPALTLMVYSGSAGTTLTFGDRGTARIDTGKPVVINAAIGDLDGDGHAELQLQLASTYGDGYTTALWIVSLDKAGLSVSTFSLGGSNGEPGGTSVDARWWLDGSALWIVRTESGHVEFSKVVYRGTTPKRLRQMAFAVVAEELPSRDMATQRMITLKRTLGGALQYFPWQSTGKKPLWGVGRIFADKASAVSWREAAGLPNRALRQIMVTAEQ